MSLPDQLQRQRAIVEWKSSLAGELFEKAVSDWKQYYLSTAGNSEYAAIVAANRCAALEDLTKSLDAYMEVATEETQDEAASGPKTSKIAVRSMPHTI